MSIFKLLPFIWPFVKELILGNKTLTEAFKDNKKKVFLTIAIMLSFALNIFAIPKLITISGQHVILQREHDEMQAQYNEMKSTSRIPGGKTVAPIEDPPRRTVVVEDVPQESAPSDPPARKGKHKPNDDRVASMRKHLDEIRHAEEKE